MKDCKCTRCGMMYEREDVVWYHGIDSDFICKEDKKLLGTGETFLGVKWNSIQYETEIELEKSQPKYVLRENNKENLVYCIYNPKTNRVKFGKSTDLERRHGEICRMAGENFRVLGVIFTDTEFDAFKKESSIHRMFLELRFYTDTIFGSQRTEWFDYTDSVQIFVSYYFEDYVFETPLEVPIYN